MAHLYRGTQQIAMSLTGHARYWYHCRVARQPATNANTYWTILFSELTGHGSPLQGMAQVYQRVIMVLVCRRPGRLAIERAC